MSLQKLPDGLGYLKLVREIGCGSYGRVYLAIDANENTQVAVKVVQMTTETPYELRQILQEATTLKSLRNPFIVRLRDYVLCGDNIFIVMDYAETTLDKFVRNDPTFFQNHPHVALYVLKQLATGLEFMHSRRPQYLWRDCKPANILLAADPEGPDGFKYAALISDLGLAKRMTQTATLSIRGSPMYTAPECVMGQACTSPIDIWALGLVFRFMMTGSEPFNVDKLEKNIVERIFAKEFPNRQLLELADGMTALDPGDRFTAQDILQHQLVKGINISTTRATHVIPPFQKLPDFVMNLPRGVTEEKALDLVISLVEHLLKLDQGRQPVLRLVVPENINVQGGTSQCVLIDQRQITFKDVAGSAQSLSYVPLAVIDKEQYQPYHLTWQVGCVLVSLLLGKSPYLDKNVSATMMRVMRDDPDISEAGRFAEFCEFCLEKMRAKVDLKSFRESLEERYAAPSMPLSPKAQSVSSDEVERLRHEKEKAEKKLQQEMARMAEEKRMLEEQLKASQNVKTPSSDAKMGTKEHFNQALEAALKEECVCGTEKAKNLDESVQNECVRCCAEHIEEAKVYDATKGKPSALMTAAEKGLADFVKLLLFYQKDFTDTAGRKVDLYASNKRIRKLLADAGVVTEETLQLKLASAEKSNCTCSQKSQNLYQAAENNCLRCCVQYIDQAGKKYGDDEETALIMATRKGFVEVIKLLFTKECKLYNKQGLTALMWAAMNGSVEVVQFLATKEIGMQDQYGQTALMYAVKQRNIEVVKYLVQKEGSRQTKQGYTALMLAAKLGEVKLINTLLNYEKNQTDNQGRKADFYATNTEIKQILVAAGVVTDIDFDAKLELAKKQSCVCSQKSQNLYEAACNNCLKCCAKYVEQAGRPYYWENTTPLMAAAMKDHIEVVKLLLNKEARITDRFGQSSLMLAAGNGFIEVAKLLIDKEAGMYNFDGETALMRAASYGYVEIVQLLMEKEAKMQRKNGNTSLIQAAQNGHLAVVKLLADKEAGMQNKQGSTALICAVQSGFVDIVSWLADKEAEMRDNANKSALDYAKTKNIPEIVRILSTHEAKATPSLSLAVQSQSTQWFPEGFFDFSWDEKIPFSPTSTQNQTQQNTANATNTRPKLDRTEVEICAGAQKCQNLYQAAENNCLYCCILFIDQAGKTYGFKQETALMAAARKGHVEVVQLLLDKEAGIQESKGWTALMLAEYEGRIDVAKLLANKEAGKQARNGWTALMLASYQNHIEVAKLLLDTEAGVQNNNGWTALMWAAQNGYADVAKLLINKEAGVQNNNGWTALMWAAKNGYADVAKLLINKEAKKQDKFGWTALILAAWNGHIEVVKLLLDKEAGQQTNYGETALMWAAKIGHVEVARLLLDKEKGIKTKNGETALLKTLVSSGPFEGRKACAQLLFNVSKERKALKQMQVKKVSETFGLK